jgi:hypothetical protein
MCNISKNTKAVPLHATKVLGARMYSSYSSSTLALEGDEWSASRPGRAVASRKENPVPTVQETGLAPELVWTQRLQDKSIRLCRGSNLNRPVVQPVATHYTDSASRLTLNVSYIWRIISKPKMFKLKKLLRCLYI